MGPTFQFIASLKDVLRYLCRMCKASKRLLLGKRGLSSAMVYPFIHVIRGGYDIISTRVLRLVL